MNTWYILKLFIRYDEDIHKRCVRLEYDRPKDRGRALASFPYDHLINGLVYLAHFSNQITCSIDLVAEDHDLSQSNQVTIYIDTFKPSIDLVLNKGLKVLTKGSSLITSENLSYKVNTPDPDIVIEYRITQKPSSGILEIQNKLDGLWHECGKFEQSDIDNNLIRYRDTWLGATNLQATDEFIFDIHLPTIPSFKNHTNLVKQTFIVKLVAVEIKLFTSELFLMRNSMNMTLKRSHIFSWLYAQDFSIGAIDPVYLITKAPSYGTLFKVIDLQLKRFRKIGQNMNFTQSDVNSGKIFFKLRYEHFTVVNDEFGFKVWTPHVISQPYTFSITYFPGTY